MTLAGQKTLLRRLSFVVRRWLESQALRTRPWDYASGGVSPAKTPGLGDFPVCEPIMATSAAAREAVPNVYRHLLISLCVCIIGRTASTAAGSLEPTEFITESTHLCLQALS